MPKKTRGQRSEARDQKTNSATPARSKQGAIDDIQVGRTNLFSIPLNKCLLALTAVDATGKKKRLNVREDLGDLNELANSMIEDNASRTATTRLPLRGFMGEDGLFHITDGERRYRAGRILEKKGFKVVFPVIREPQKYSESERTLDLLRTNNGKPLDMLEKAHAFKRLVDLHALKPKDIAAKSGYSTTHVTDCLILLQAAPEVQAAVKSGEMKATLAVDLVRQVNDVEKQRDILQAGREKAHSTSSGSATGGTTSVSSTNKKGKGRKKITAKNLPIATGKKARNQRSEVRGQKSGVEAAATGPIFERETSIGTPVLKDKEASRLQANMLDDLMESVSRNDCIENAYETVETVRDYLAGDIPLKNATKFLLGM